MPNNIMEFKINKKYSNKIIEKYSYNISISGNLKGGEHTITTKTNTFIMLLEGAWRGGNVLYYKCIK
jgi:hypothetical protein